MRIGVAKEIKQDEYRVALTPGGRRRAPPRGHEVVVEAGAGAGSAFPDADYEAVGAGIATVDDVWATLGDGAQGQRAAARRSTAGCARGRSSSRTCTSQPTSG